MTRLRDLKKGDAVRSRFFSTFTGQKQYYGVVTGFTEPSFVEDYGQVRHGRVLVKLVPRDRKRRVMDFAAEDLTKIAMLDLLAKQAR